MGILDDLFGGPENEFRDIPREVNQWWDSIEAKREKALIRIPLGEVTLVLHGDPEHGKAEYLKAHPGANWSDVGISWSDGASNEIWAPYKRTEAGNIIWNKWAIGHELMHAVGRSRGFGNPDDVGKKEFYKK